MMNFQNKTILITGASSGIGETLALALAKEADTLILVARRKDKLNILSEALCLSNKQLKVITLAKDITNLQHQTELKVELEEQQITVDILINCAGIGNDALFKDADWHKLEDIIELNIKSLTHITYLLLPQIIKSKGCLVFIGSGAGIAWMPGSATYSASKHYVTALAMVLRGELKPMGVQVSLVCPGPVESGFNEASGIQGGLKGGPADNMLITSAECAAAIIKGVKKGKSLILPGKKYRWLMNAYINFPWFLKRILTESEGEKFFTAKTWETNR